MCPWTGGKTKEVTDELKYEDIITRYEPVFFFFFFFFFLFFFFFFIGGGGGGGYQILI